jgi:DNA-binding MarR family transcriptional regulator
MKIDATQTPDALGTVVMAERIRAFCSVITKIARTDLDSRLKNNDSGISAFEHGVLRHLSHGVTSMAEISRLMGVAPSTLVYVVDGLTKKRLVKRGKDPKDRRREPLLLQKKGIALFASIPRMDASSALVRSLETLTESKRRDLLALLNDLVTGLAGSERLYLHSEPEETNHPLAATAKGPAPIPRTSRR